MAGTFMMEGLKMNGKRAIINAQCSIFNGGSPNLPPPGYPG